MWFLVGVLCFIALSDGIGQYIAWKAEDGDYQEREVSDV